MREAISTTAAPTPGAPFAQAIDGEDLVFVAGQIGLSPDGAPIPDGVHDETCQLLANVEAILAAADLTLDDVVKTTVFVTDFAGYAEMNRAYEERFTEPYPARSTVRVAGLLAGARVEIEAIARRPTEAR